MCTASPLRIGEPNARIAPAFSPIPARWDTYLTIELEPALIESKLSAMSINTQDEN